MDNCRHITKLAPALTHSVLNPQNWACMVCGTTDSVWACLSCSNVACGRYISEHALKHYEETGHSLALEVNDRYVFCYHCSDYVLNDNAAGDIQVLRSCLQTITTRGRLSSSEVGDGHKRLLRSCSVVALGKSFEELNLEEEDRKFTAIWFRRRCALAKAFKAWRRHVTQVSSSKAKKRKNDDSSAALDDQSAVDHVVPDQMVSTGKMELRPMLTRLLVPGMTGLRNLGNTCYINSVLQAISHLQEFRDHFVSLSRVRRSSESSSRHNFMRQTTMECFEYVNSGAPNQQSRGGLSGGSSSASSASDRISVDTNSTSNLTDELSALFRVMWSGKWAVVSPHRFLLAVWTKMPFFKGYTQHDAQEFLSELFDKIQVERNGSTPGTECCINSRDIILCLCRGELISQVTYLSCGHSSRRVETFSDLSLDFPQRYHAVDGSSHSPSVESIHVKELLDEFTRVEKLDGPVYSCDACNEGNVSSEQVRSEAEKRILLSRLPVVLRLHLKRFMWGGRNSRGKIPAHVDFDDVLRLDPMPIEDENCRQCEYRLASVIVHHGRGFGSGHYTAYCRNESAGLWVHCNDSVVTACSVEDVHRAQAYIIVYVRVDCKSSVATRNQESTSVCSEAKRNRVDKSVTYDLRSRTPTIT